MKINKFNKRNKQFHILYLCDSHMILHTFFKQHFYKQSLAEIGKKKFQAHAMQHPEAGLLLFENYSCSSPNLSSKNSRTYSKK